MPSPKHLKHFGVLAPAVAPGLVCATVRSAGAWASGTAAGVVSASVLTLMEGVRHTMLWNTWKAGLAVLLVLGQRRRSRCGRQENRKDEFTHDCHFLTFPATRSAPRQMSGG